MKHENPYFKKFEELAIATHGHLSELTAKRLKRDGEAWQEGVDAAIKWGDEYCDNPEHNEIEFPAEIGGGIVHKSRRKRRRCSQCWAECREEIGLK
jgi:hypothetical protein